VEVIGHSSINEFVDVILAYVTMTTNINVVAIETVLLTKMFIPGLLNNDILASNIIYMYIFISVILLLLFIILQLESIHQGDAFYESIHQGHAFYEPYDL